MTTFMCVELLLDYTENVKSLKTNLAKFINIIHCMVIIQYCSTQLRMGESCTYMNLLDVNKHSLKVLK